MSIFAGDTLSESVDSYWDDCREESQWDDNGFTYFWEMPKEKYLSPPAGYQKRY